MPAYEAALGFTEDWPYRKARSRERRRSYTRRRKTKAARPMRNTPMSAPKRTDSPAYDITGTEEITAGLYFTKLEDFLDHRRRVSTNDVPETSAPDMIRKARYTVNPAQTRPTNPREHRAPPVLRARERHDAAYDLQLPLHKLFHRLELFSCQPRTIPFNPNSPIPKRKCCSFS